MQAVKLVSVLAAAMLAVGTLAPAKSAYADPAQTNAIEIPYVVAKNPRHQTIYEQLREHHVLERLQQLLSPFYLPRKLTVRVEGCNGEIDAWYENDAVTVCYEYLDYVWRNSFKRTTLEGGTQINVMLGPLFDVFLHEFGHVVFDVLDVPLFGREEDAADQFSAYIMLHFGKAEARRLILETAYAYKLEDEDPPEKSGMARFADEHGTPAQRFYNLLCIAYGAEADLFADVVKEGYLPKDRAEGCKGEYRQVRKAFQRLISPHIDLTMAREICRGQRNDCMPLGRE
jgi:Putative metallopeptidase